MSMKRSSTGLEFDLRWARKAPAGTAAEATRGRLAVRVGAHEVWPLGKSTETWPWVELFEYLVSAWRYLVDEPGVDPLGLGGPPTTLWKRAEDRWATMAEGRAEREEEMLSGFLRMHDLSEGLRGTLAPSLYVLRYGDRVQVASEGVNEELPWEQVRTSLEMLGEKISRRLAALEDPRAQDAVERWRRRDDSTPGQRLQVATGWDATSLERLAGGKSKRKLEAVLGRDATDDPMSSPLAWAARMIDPASPPEALRALFRAVRDCGARDATALDAWRGSVQLVSASPYEQGYALAAWLRSRVSAADDQPFEIRGFLAALGVEVIDVEADGVSADAICVWQRNQLGPVIAVNTRGPHARGHRGLRATLAHELCHLLIDFGGRELPMAEAKTRSAPADLEARCNAFAAELLLPRAIAAREFGDVTLAGIEPAVEDIARRYEASRAVVAWQVLNSTFGEHMGKSMTQRFEAMARRQFHQAR
ncbi:MAG: ImmA/IrrE family metallo-endopeptidase [Deltaproteobacteria bacterium]|nr:ImmA/IrrE family metallo-endopeptidase [Deltaproteobacteria bacterium]